MVTKTTEYQLERTVEAKQYESMAFPGGRFTGTLKNWTTYEKGIFRGRDV